MDELTLLDWKRRIFALYAEVRAADDPESAWQRWREVRADLYRTHPQSPRVGGEPAYFPYDAALRFEARVERVEPAPLEIAGSGGSTIAFAGLRLRTSAARASSSTGSTRTAAGSSCLSAMRRAGAKPTAPAATCSTR